MNETVDPDAPQPAEEAPAEESEGERYNGGEVPDSNGDSESTEPSEPSE